MLNIKKKSEGTKLTFVLEGRLDTETSHLLDDEVAGIPDIVVDLVFDMDDLEYVSSSGLRVLLVAAKIMNDRGGTCSMVNVPELIRETFEITGLTNVFTIA